MDDIINTNVNPNPVEGGETGTNPAVQDQATPETKVKKERKNLFVAIREKKAEARVVHPKIMKAVDITEKVIGTGLKIGGGALLGYKLAEHAQAVNDAVLSAPVPEDNLTLIEDSSDAAMSVEGEVVDTTVF